MKPELKVGHPTAMESAERLSVYASESRSEVMRLLFTKAGNAGRTASELATAIKIKLPSLNDYANTARPRIGTVEKFLRALKVQHPKIVARALMGELRPEDELRIGQGIMFTFSARSRHFRAGTDPFSVAISGIRNLEREDRRAVMSQFLLADQGLIDADPLDVLASELRKHGVDLAPYVDDNLLERQREAYMALLWAREALAMNIETWQAIEQAVAPRFDGYPGWESRWPTESDTETLRAAHDR